MALLSPVAAGAQAAVHAATFDAEVEPDGAVAFSVAYRLEGAAPGSGVAVSLLAFDGLTVSDVRGGSSSAPVTLTTAGDAAFHGVLPAEDDGAGSTVVRASYVVRLPQPEGGSVVVRLPVLTVDLQPGEARPGLFQGRLRVPEGWRVTEGFPTGMAAADGDPSLFAVELQVVPSMVGLRARTDGGWAPSLPLVLDGVALAALLLFAGVGWRYLAGRS